MLSSSKKAPGPLGSVWTIGEGSILGGGGCREAGGSWDSQVGPVGVPISPL